MPLRTLRLDTSWGALQVSGGSRAGEGTLILLPQLRLALDAGRPHRALPSMTTVAVSHGHVDHVGGVAYWASQRHLNSMPGGTVLAPRPIEAQVRRLLALHAALEGGDPYDVTVEGVDSDSVRSVRRDLELGFFATDHWVPTLGSELVWLHRHLRSELAGLPGEEIARRRAAGEDVTAIDRVRLLAYAADSGPAVLQSAAIEAEVLLMECSFFRPADRSRAARYGHMHLDDLLGAVERLRCRHLVVLHASRRHRIHDAEAWLAEKLKPVLPCRLHHLFVDWE